MTPIERIDQMVSRAAPAGLLDRLADRMETALVTSLGATPSGKQALEFLRGRSWLGHPLHPLMTDLVTGAWSIAWLLDLLEMVGVNRFRPGADAAVLIGLAGVPSTALAGAADWQQLSGSPRRVGVVHANLNTLAATCYAISSIQRMRGRRGTAHLWGNAGFALVNASAYLGGELVFNAGSSVRVRPGQTGNIQHDGNAEPIANEQSIRSPAI